MNLVEQSADARLQSAHFRLKSGFTLIELLVVIAIIAILAAMLMVALGPSKLSVQKMAVRADMKAIETAIIAYHGAYSRYPLPTNVITADFTFGPASVASATNNYANENSDLMAILLDEDAGCNSGHQKNPQKTAFLQQSKRANSTNSAGIGPDLVFRDPWGTPYIISIDYDFDDKCHDVFYSQKTVSQQTGNVGYNALNSEDGGQTFFLRGPVMIWSMGPPVVSGTSKGTSDTGKTANVDPNKSHILNWVK